MKMLKKNGGFTLVELIIVIAILAILAGVAVPAYSGYITKANEASDITSLDAIKTACFAANAENGAVTKIVVVASNGGITSVKIDYGTTTGAEIKDNADFKTFMPTLPTLKAWKTGAEWNGTEWVKK